MTSVPGSLAERKTTQFIRSSNARNYCIYLNQRLSDQSRTGYSTIQASALNHFDDHFHSIMFSTQEPLEWSVLARAEQNEEWLYSVCIVQFDFTRRIGTIAKFVFQSLNIERIAFAIG